MWETFTNHCQFNLTTRQAPSQVVSMVFASGCVMYLSVVVLHAFIPTPQPVFDVLLHAAAIAATYTLAIGIAILAIVLMKPSGLRVWQVWVLSFVVYAGGFWLSRFVDVATADIKYELHPDLQRGDGLFHFLRLVPVWLAISYTFIVMLQRAEYQQELKHLAAINDQLSTKTPAQQAAKIANTIEFESGKKRIRLQADQINCVSVDDHYCSIFVDSDNGPARHDVSQPLKAIEIIMPPNFVRVHRSHIVNLDRVTSVQRLDRNLRLHVGTNSMAIPVSRSQVSMVLALLEERQ